MNYKYPESKRKNDEVFISFGQTTSYEKEWIAMSIVPTTMMYNKCANLEFRKNAAIVALCNGDTMIVGGRLAGRMKYAQNELYTYKSRLTRRVIALNIPRERHGACAVDNDVIVCGGHNGLDHLKSCEIYLHCENRWGFFPEMNENRYGVAVVSLPDRRIFAIGGLNENWDDLSSVEVCRLPVDIEYSSDIPLDSWQSFAPMREARSGHGAVVFGGIIFVAGGWKYSVGQLSSVEMFPINSSDNVWISLSMQLKEKRSWFYLAATSKGLYALGSDYSPRNSIEVMKIKGRCIDESKSSEYFDFEDIYFAYWESLPSIEFMERIWGTVSIPRKYI